MCVLSIKYIVLVLSREDEQINSLFGFVHHHKDIPFHFSCCPATRAMGHQSAERCEGAFARASGGFCFLPSPLHPYVLSCWARERKVWRFLSFFLHPLFTHSRGAVKVRRALSIHPKMVEIVCVVVVRWRVKAKSENSVSAYARGGGAKASPAVFTRGEQSGCVFRFSGGEMRESGPLFSFSLEFFWASIDRWSRGVGRWEESACEMGMGLRFDPWDAGAASTAWWGENTARNASQRRCALSRCSSFVFMLSLNSGEKAPVFFFELWEFVRFAADFRF